MRLWHRKCDYVGRGRVWQLSTLGLLEGEEVRLKTGPYEFADAGRVKSPTRNFGAWGTLCVAVLRLS